MEQVNKNTNQTDSTSTIITIARKSGETEVQVSLGFSPGDVVVSSGIPFFDHLLSSLAFHAGWTLKVQCSGDLRVDDHHSVEDCAIVLGLAFREALPGLANVRRFGWAFAPLDESLARAVVDLSGRPYCEAELALRGFRIGSLSCENIPHALASFAANAGITLHVDVLKGENDHHKAEAAFKALALAFREALATRPGTEVPIASTKGKPEIMITRTGLPEEAS